MKGVDIRVNIVINVMILAIMARGRNIQRTIHLPKRQLAIIKVPGNAIKGMAKPLL
jgi:hypothetical protein